MRKKILFIPLIIVLLASCYFVLGDYKICRPAKASQCKANDFNAPKHQPAANMELKEKILRINISREPMTLDPRQVHDPSHQAINAMLYEGLTKLSSDLTVSLACAESYKVSPDRLTYIFRLGDHRWSDGTKVTAFDFERTFLDLVDPKFPSPHTHLLYCIKNAQACKKGDLLPKDVGIRAQDAKTIEFTLERPSPFFLQILASPRLAPFSENLFNGPFVLHKWDRHVELELRPNPYYSGYSYSRPLLDAVKITMIENETSALHMYASGYLDVIGTPFSQIPLVYLKDLKEEKLLKVQPAAVSLFCAFNTLSPLFQNGNLRKAFATAANRQEIIEHITLLDDEPGLGAIPSILKKGKTKAWIQDGNAKEAREYLRLALSELNLSKEDLPEITLYYWPFEINGRIAQTLQQQWEAALGIHVRIEVIEFKSLLAKVANGSYQIAIFAWAADYADPLALLDRFRRSEDAQNYSRWESAKFSALLDASSGETDPDRRLAILEEAEGVLMEAMPIAPLFHWSFPCLVQPHITGFAMNALGAVRFQDVSVEMTPPPERPGF